MKWTMVVCQPADSFAFRLRSAVAVVAAVALLGLVFAAPAAASDPSFVQAFGLNVGGAGVNVCTTTCQQGSMGAAADEFNDANGVAVSGSGDVYVADTYNNRIDEFGQSGSFVRAFGSNVGGTGVNVCTTSCQAGSTGGAAGEFAYPGGVAVAGSGDVYVADGDNSRIDEFSQAGSFIEAFGLNVGGAGVPA
jgi:NHL repeat